MTTLPGGYRWLGFWQSFLVGNIDSQLPRSRDIAESDLTIIFDCGPVAYPPKAWKGLDSISRKKRRITCRADAVEIREAAERGRSTLGVASRTRVLGMSTRTSALMRASKADRRFAVPR